MKKWNWLNIKLLMLFGLCRSRAERSRTKLIMRCISYFWLIYGIFPRCLHFADLLSAMIGGKNKDAIFCALVVVFDMSAFLRHIILEIKGDEYLAAVDFIDELTINTREYIKEIVDEEIAIRTKRCWLAFYLFTFQPFLFILHFIVRPFIDATIYNRPEARFFECYSFIKRETWMQFFMLWSFESFHFIGSTTIIIIYEGLFFTMLEWILGHIEILKKELQLIDFTDLKNKSKNNEQNPEKPCTISINQAINHHQSILKVSGDLKSASAFVIQGTCVGSGIITMLTIAALTVSYDEFGKGKLINMVEIGFAHVFHLFLLSFMCEELTYQSAELYKHIYNTRWYNGTKSQKMKLNIMMTMTNHPVTLGGFIIVSLANFIAIMKTGFSYYNYLITLK